MIWFFLAVVLVLLVYAPGFRRVVLRLAAVGLVLILAVTADIAWRDHVAATPGTDPYAALGTPVAPFRRMPGKRSSAQTGAEECHS